MADKKIKKRKISEKQNIKKKGYDQARGRTRVNISEQFSSDGENSRSGKSLSRTPRLHCFFLIGE